MIWRKGKNFKRAIRVISELVTYKGGPWPHGSGGRVDVFLKDWGFVARDPPSADGRARGFIDLEA